MSTDGTQPLCPGIMTQDPGVYQGAFTRPLYNPGGAYEEHMPSSYHAFSRPAPCPQRQATTPPIPQDPNGQGLTMHDHVPGASAHSPFPGGNAPLTEAIPTPVSNRSTLGAATTSFNDPVAATPYRPPHAVNTNFQTRPQTAEPNTSNHPQNYYSGASWPVQPFYPAFGFAPHCPVATGAYQQFGARPFMPQTPIQPVNSAQFPQTGVSGLSLASIHPQAASAIAQTQLPANSFGAGSATPLHGYSGGTPHHLGRPSIGPSYHPPSVSDPSASAVFLPPHADVHANSFVPSHSPGAPSLRYRRSRRMSGPAQRFEAIGASGGGHVSRHALPKGLDDPLDTRPEPKETAEMTINMECKVCMSQPVDTVVFPCGHAMFCRWCAEKCMPSQRTEKGRVKDSSRCPVCRCIVRQKFRIFLP